MTGMPNVRRQDLMEACMIRNDGPHISSCRPGFDGWLVRLVALGGALALGGCSGSMSSESNTAPAQVQVTVGGAGQVRLGATAQLTATVTNSTNTAVTWEVGGVSG